MLNTTNTGPNGSGAARTGLNQLPALLSEYEQTYAATARSVTEPPSPGPTQKTLTSLQRATAAICSAPCVFAFAKHTLQATPPLLQTARPAGDTHLRT